MAYGIVSDWLAMKSWPSAARPPTCVSTPSTVDRTDGRHDRGPVRADSGASGLTASSRTVEPRM